MCLFGKRHKRSLEKEVCNLHFRNPVGVQYVSGNLLLAGKHCALSGFVTLNPPKENVLQWITGLQQFRRKTVLAVNISSDIFRTFSLVYDFADFIIIDPDSDNGIDSPDVGDTAQLLEQIVSQRLCYEHYTPVFLRLSHGTTPAELHPLLGCCQLYGIDGAVVHGSRKMQLAIEETKGRLPIIGVAENQQDALEQLQSGAVLVETNFGAITLTKLLKTLENQPDSEK